MNTTAPKTSGGFIRIVVADKHDVFRQGLLLILNSQADMTVVGECGGRLEALELILKLTPDVSILSFGLSRWEELELVAAILRQQPLARILLLAELDGDYELAHAALAAGVRGYLPKESTKVELLRAVREISAGCRHFIP